MTTAEVTAVTEDAARARLRRRRALGYTVLVAFALVFVYPFLLSAATAFKSLPDIQANPVVPWASGEYGGWTLDGIAGLDSQSIQIPRWTVNSVVVTVAVVMGRVLFDSMAGYALARLKFPGRGLAFALVIAVMAIPGIILAIPRFLVMKELGILNSYSGLIVPLMFDAFGIFLMKQFFEMLPRELVEAAKIDGASSWQIFSKVMLPLAAPGLITLTILATQGVWNEFLHYLVAAPSEPDLKTLTVGLAGISAAFGEAPPWNTVLAGTLITTIPIAIVFFVFQRYFVQGLAATGIKG